MNVYVISSSAGVCKVGKAKDPAARLRELSTGHPFDLTLHGVRHMETDRAAFALEWAMHRKLDFCWIRGEWFRIPAETAWGMLQTTNAADVLSEAYPKTVRRKPKPKLCEGEASYPCGHPRTPENTKPHGKQTACRTCRQAIERKAQAKRRAKRREQ